MTAVPVALSVVAVLVSGCSAQDIAFDTFSPPARDGQATLTVHDRWESCDKVASAVSASATAGEGASTTAEEGAGDLLDQERFDQEAFSLPLLDDGFQPVAAIICGRGPDGGYDWVAEEARAEDLTAMLAALRLPDEAPTAEACTLELPAVPRLFLLDSAGRWIRPGIPIDACAKPRTEVTDAYYALVITVESRRVLKQG
ncbi:hypothetical protein [Actinoplanes derwentensis]|nr:hypothetical protein [Actinoplanes derwentensis]